jgi:hypothetical protein
MTIEEYVATLAESKPPAGLNPILVALWQDAKGNWAVAHEIAQSWEGTTAFDRLHAYLHRKEGDTGNARYWYRRAGAEVFEGSLEQEWREFVTDRLSDEPAV